MVSAVTESCIRQQVARKAFFALWNSKSSLSLVGNTINIVRRKLGLFTGADERTEIGQLDLWRLFHRRRYRLCALVIVQLETLLTCRSVLRVHGQK